MIRSAAVSSVLALSFLVLPAPVEAQDPPPRATVTGMALDTVDLTTPEGRRALLRSRNWEPREPPPFVGERTLFYGQRATQVQEGSQVLLVPAAEVPTLSPSTFHSASWVVPPGEEPEVFGRIAAFGGGQDVRLGRSTVLPYDDVRLTFSEEVTLAPGDEIMAVRRGDRVYGVGQVMIPTGVLEIRRVDSGGAVARLVRDFSKAELGNEVMAMRTFTLSPGVYPSETSTTFSARVIAFEERKELYLPGDRLFIDAGAADGLRVGDEFMALAGSDSEWHGADAGDFQVVGVSEHTATLRIVQSRLPSLIRREMTLTLTRVMP